MERIVSVISFLDSVVYLYNNVLHILVQLFWIVMNFAKMLIKCRRIILYFGIFVATPAPCYSANHLCALFQFALMHFRSCIATLVHFWYCWGEVSIMIPQYILHFGSA